MGKSEKVQGWMCRLFFGAYLVLFAWLYFQVWRNAGNAVLFAGGALGYGAAAVALVYYFGARIDAMQKRSFLLLMAGLLAAYFGAVLYLGWCMRIPPDYDFGIVYEAVDDLLQDGIVTARADYFVRCKNNIGLLLILSLVYRVGGWFGFSTTSQLDVLPGIVFNALCITLTVLFVCCIARRLFGRNTAVLLSFALCAAFVAYYLWAPSFYTHTVSMPFVVGAVLCYVLFRDAKTPRRWLWLALCALLCAGGYLVKGNIMVVCVAAILALALDMGVGWRQKLAGVLVFSAVAGGALAAFNSWTFHNSAIDFTDYDAQGLPVELWFCMGSHGEGKWDGDDRAYALSFPTMEQRKAALREEIKQNYTAYTPATYYSFLQHKTLTTWCDGKFGAQISHNNPIEYNWTRYIVFERYAPFKAVTLHSQLYLQMLYLLCLVSLVRCVRCPRGNVRLLLHLCVFGLMLFLMFWESWASYVLNFTPLLLLIGADSILWLAGKLPPRRKKHAEA